MGKAGEGAGGLQRGMPACGACGPRQDPAPSWQAEGPAAVMTTLGRPPGAVGWRLASQTCRLCSGLPWSLSVTVAPLPPPPPPRALTPGHMLNPPRLMGHFPSCPGEGRGCQERGPRKSFQQLPSRCPVPQTRLVPGAVSIPHVAPSSLSCCGHSGGVPPCGTLARELTRQEGAIERDSAVAR